MIIPLYQAELAHPSIRGRVTSLQQFMLGIGAFIASWAAFGCYTSYGDRDSRQWRIPLGIQMLPAVLLAALILFFPESPRVRIFLLTPLTKASNVPVVEMHHDFRERDSIHRETTSCQLFLDTSVIWKLLCLFTARTLFTLTHGEMTA